LGLPTHSKFWLAKAACAGITTIAAGGSLLLDLLSRLARRDAPRTEADVQADVRQLFLTAPFQLEEGDIENVYLESPLATAAG
jgi:hypothetical protein